MRSNASCDAMTFMLPCQCFATLTSELPDERLRESAPENDMAASARMTSMKNDAFNGKAKDLLELYGSLPTEERPRHLHQTVG